MVANHVTFGPRASIRETAKALGADQREINRFVQLWSVGDDSQIPAYIRNPAERIRGMPHYLGTHCGGVVITPREMTHYVHYQRSNQGYPLIAWDKDGAEAAGLVKIDLLGNRSLSVLRDSLDSVRVTRKVSLSWDSRYYLGDRATREMIEDADTVGIFYIESPATRQLLKKMRKADYELLVVATSIIRPAAKRYLRWYVDRLHGKPYRELHPLFDGILVDTYGIMVYQEDVSRVAVSVAGFTAEEADRLRKLLERRDRDRWLPEMKSRFFRAGRGRGVGDRSLQAIWEMILSFRGYSFCKPHSASYALVSYKLAYLKRHFPLEFMVSVINNGGGYYSRQTYINAARRMGFPIRGPDVNRSGELCAPEDQALRLGLRFLKDLPEKTLKRILDDRRASGPYLDVVDFQRRSSCGFPEMSLLIRSGSLDSLAGGLSRPQQFWVYLSARKRQDLFELPTCPSYLGDYSPQRRLMEEAKTLGLIISCHPIDLFRSRIAEAAAQADSSPFISSREIPMWVSRRVALAGLLVVGKEARTQTEEDMIFLSFEDGYSLYETVLFPPVFRRYHRILRHMAVYLVGGKVVNEQGALIIEVLSLRRLCRDPDGEETSSVNVRPRTRSRWQRSAEPQSAG